MHAATYTPAIARIGASDRLGLTLFFAVALHAIVILGITFSPDDQKSAEAPRALEVILVHSKSNKNPDKADYLAQVTQQGGGDMREKLRPTSPFANSTARSEQGTAPTSQPLMAPPPSQVQDPRTVMTVEQSRLKTQHKPGEKRPLTPDTPTAAELIPPSQEVARLAAEINQRVQNYAREPRSKYITASTQEYVAAAYEYAWRMKVERIGNLNYPDEARRANLSGDLLLDVAINADGSLNNVKVIRPSGHHVLDEGAMRIVKLSAPFAPLPSELRKTTDVLHIIRTWQFQSDNSLQTR